MRRIFIFAALLLAPSLGLAQIPKPAGAPTRGDLLLEDYFRNETAALSSNCLANVTSLADWQSQRAEYRRQLQEMLGLWPMPERTDLKPVITGHITNEEFVVEKLYFQASPKLYVTANLFLPRNLTKPAPTILYECGHWSAKTNGMNLGNKAVYQNDGAWYARNGYVCLVADTLLAGEIPGIHTGTRDHGLWWWNSRGYTPAGVEAWFGIRCLDYLCTRPEVDTNRFGITGHSGGGAYSWTVTALDDRIKVAAPMAGLADAQSHIDDGVIDSHCDCNFCINIYRWDFPQLAALAAPRPLLIGGTDRDPLFHLDSTLRIYEKVRGIYHLYGATNQLGLIEAPGIHDEVPEMQVAVLRWFNRYLKGVETPVDAMAKRLFVPSDLKVFQTLPADAINTNIADTFVRTFDQLGMSTAATNREQLCMQLRQKVFSGWPEKMEPVDPAPLQSATNDGVTLTVWRFESQHDMPLRLYIFENTTHPASDVDLHVLDQNGWTNWLAAVNGSYDSLLSDELTGFKGSDFKGFATLKAELLRKNKSLAFFAPRGIGMTAYSGDEKRLTKIRRRFMLLGQTLDGMRVWDIRSAISVLQGIRTNPSAGPNVELNANGPMAVNALYASLFENKVTELNLSNLPPSQKQTAPDYLGVLKVTDIPEVKEAIGTGANVTLLR